MTASPISERSSYIISRGFTRLPAASRKKENGGKYDREREERKRIFVRADNDDRRARRKKEDRTRWGRALFGALIGNFADCRLQTRRSSDATRASRYMGLKAWIKRDRARIPEFWRTMERSSSSATDLSDRETRDRLRPVFATRFRRVRLVASIIECYCTMCAYTLLTQWNLRFIARVICFNYT